MQLLAELLIFQRVILFPVLLALESSANRLEYSDDFAFERGADGVYKSFDIFTDPLGDRREGAIGGGNVIHKVGVTDIFQFLAWELMLTKFRC